jgi:hypothetical protein
MRTFLTIAGILIFSCTFGQDSKKYSELINEAWKLYESREYLKSGQKYAEAFEALGDKCGFGRFSTCAVVRVG